jgi:hypothetical protein
MRELGTMLAVTGSPILDTLMIEAIRSSETSVLKIGTRHHIQKTAFLMELLCFTCAYVYNQMLSTLLSFRGYIAVALGDFIATRGPLLKFL